MAANSAFNYKTESNRYNYYYRRLKIFYEKPVTQVSSAVLFSLATILFFAVFAIRPTLITIGELLKKIDNQEVILEKAEKKVASLASAQQLYNKVAPSLAMIDTAVPPDYQIQQLLLAIEASAAQQNIPINNLSLSKLEYPVSQPKAYSVQELEFTLSFDTSYPSARLLLSSLEQLPRLVSLDSISFRQGNGANQRANTQADAITVTLNGRVFYYPETK